ncbi:MarR family transcriptional regulator [Natrinema halophilum]|uniref:MarR family transcriptional regulator n=1 Tax=Natrinema halophilum TaxID=1699371 RepID=A0A7D5GGQ6_9EURY|nr:MarR family transcriptional regulator [Natrinema halophilum]QLG48454.1 MarR family transcriptional regulator [Natrinema halophilum]
MSSQKRRLATNLDPVPDDLESARAKLVYMYLDAADGATVEELSEIMAMKKLDVLSVLNSLSRSGFVDRAGPEYVVTD